MGLSGKKLTGVAAVVGPATPGGVRLAVTVANALAWGLGVPVARFRLGGKISTAAFGRWVAAGNLRPIYLHGPNITRPRK